jgi:hypothetical protein
MRFANARLAAYEAYLALTVLGSIPECQQALQFLVAADKPGNVARVLSFETTRDPSRPGHAAGADRLGNSGDCVLRRILANESTAEESAGTRSDEDGVGSRLIAHSCGNK